MFSEQLFYLSLRYQQNNFRMGKLILSLFLLYYCVCHSQELSVKGAQADTIQYGKIRLMIKDMNFFIKNSPNNAEHYFKRGKYYFLIQDYKAALADFTKSISLSKGTSAAPYYKRGSVYDRLGDYGNAVMDFTQVIELMPNWEWGYNDRGVIYTEIGDYQKAEADLLKTVALKPQWTIGYANLARVYDKKNDTQKAIENYLKAIKLDDSNYPAHNNLGFLYFKNKEYDKAIAQYDLAIKYSPRYLNAYRNRADAKNIKGDTAGACEDIKAAAAMGDKKALELSKKCN